MPDNKSSNNVYAYWVEENFSGGPKDLENRIRKGQSSLCIIRKYTKGALRTLSDLGKLYNPETGVAKMLVILEHALPDQAFEEFKKLGYDIKEEKRYSEGMTDIDKLI